MKSEKAKEFIEDYRGLAEDYEGYCGFIVLEHNAVTAVEIAEEDMIEKAVKAFAEACEMYAGNERCLECVKCRDCERVKQFRQRLEKP